MENWEGVASEVLASQAESDEFSNDLGGSVSEEESTPEKNLDMEWTVRLKKLAKDAGFVAPLKLSKMDPLTVVSSCTGSCAEGAVLKD